MLLRISLPSQRLMDDCKETGRSRSLERYSESACRGGVDLLLQYLTRLARVDYVRGALTGAETGGGRACLSDLARSGRRNAGDNDRQSDEKGGCAASRNRINCSAD